jgi:hypothetical protein
MGRVRTVRAMSASIAPFSSKARRRDHTTHADCRPRSSVRKARSFSLAEILCGGAASSPADAAMPPACSMTRHRRRCYGQPRWAHARKTTAWPAPDAGGLHPPVLLRLDKGLPRSSLGRHAIRRRGWRRRPASHSWKTSAGGGQAVTTAGVARRQELAMLEHP